MPPFGGKRGASGGGGGGGRFKEQKSGSKFAAPKRAKAAAENEGEPAPDEDEIINLKQYMAPIEYHTTMADKFSKWKPVKFDSKTLGAKCDFTGMLSIETIDGDEADELLRNLGKLDGEDGDGKKKKKKKKKGAAAAEEAEEAAQEHGTTVGEKKKKKAKNTAEEAAQEHGTTTGEKKKKKAKNTAVDDSENAQPAAGKKGKKAATKGVDSSADTTPEQGKKTQKKRERPEAEGAGDGAKGAADGEGGDSGEPPRKKKKTQKERKEEKRLRLEKQAEKQAGKQAASAAARAAEMGSEDEEEAAEGEGEAEEETDMLQGRAADYDDGYEYEDWGGVMMRKCITKALLEKGFASPTPIQAAVLPAALAKRRDIFGAAETGSGKTLAFALPMLQRILESGSFIGDHSGEAIEGRQLSGLVMSPTRELALQVRDHIAAAAKYTPIKVLAIVGGLAVQKQQRLLLQRPHIIVGTPGRLWEQMRLGNEYLNTLHMLLCVVIDEADRMLESGHFEELENILRALPIVDPNSKRRKQIRADNEEEEEEEEEEEITSFMSAKADAPTSAHTERHYRRQTLVFSATLIRDFQWRKKSKSEKSKKDEKKKKKNDKKKKGDKSRGDQRLDDEAGLDGDGLKKRSIERLMDQLELPEEPLIIDLSPHGKVSEKIEQLRVECLALDKEVHIYRFLMRHFSGEERQRSASGDGQGGGRVIVFVNAIGEARRLANLLSCLRIKTFLLHSGLQQRQRLKHLDSFKSNHQAVMICTDIASRGLDIPAVEVVLHYHVPKVPSIYVHRCGRTARGSVQQGRSILFVSPQEHFHLQKVCDIIGSDISVWSEEGPFLEEARKRLVVARKLEAEQNKFGKGARERSWMKQQAEELEMEISDDEDEEDMKHNASSKRISQLQEQLDRMLDSHLLPKGVSPRFVTGSHHTNAGLPEMLGFGSIAGSMKQSEEGGYGQRRKLKPGKKGKKKK